MTMTDPLTAVPKDRLPRHVAVIMDGNGRWAQIRGMPRNFGHKQGVESTRRLVRAAHEIGLEALTIYGFSTENWSRPAEEVSLLMGKPVLGHRCSRFLEQETSHAKNALKTSKSTPQ